MRISFSRIDRLLRTRNPVVALVAAFLIVGAFVQQSDMVLRDAHARDSFVAKVKRIVDGDTVIVIGRSGREERIRLSGIDAPERSQPWGEASTRELRRQTAGRDVVVEWSKRDRYGRVVGKLLRDGKDINLHQVETGAAWWYRKYAKEQSPDDRHRYESAEESARDAGKGLWSSPNPISPWEWRRHNH